jgi:uncharacterized metal-binding protein YceD (DUF177 family)
MGKSHYKIQFGGLSMGEHQFEFEVTQTFFAQFKDSEITKAQILVKANLVKQNNLMHILFNFEGTVNLSCDRCLIDYDCPISGTEKLIIKHGKPEESNDEILVLKEGLEEADFTQYLYEYIELAIPSRKVPCEDDEFDGDVECDEDTLAKYNELKTEEEPSENPEWDKLKNIKFNNN